MKKLALALLALAPGAAYAAAWSVTQVAPAPGAVLEAGQVVRIAWQVEMPEDTLTTDCEQELFLSLDGGLNNHFRLTPMMSPHVREYFWTVPNVAAKRAVLDLRFGCAESEEMFTWSPWNPQVSHKFQIVAKRANNAVSVPQLDQVAARPGDTVNLRWDSSVKGVSHYQVLASFDRGNNFVPVGSTRTTAYAWRIPDGALGGVIFQIVARKRGGAAVGSPISLEHDLVIRD